MTTETAEQPITEDDDRRVSEAHRVFLAEINGARAVATRSGMSFMDWAVDIKEAQTGTLDFERYPYQKEPYEVLGEGANAVVRKGTQVGMSTLALRWALWVAGELSGTVMYVFPVKDQVYKFSDQRVKPVIRNSEYLRSLMAHDDPNNKGLKKVRDGYVYFVGSRSVTELDSVPANALVLDEYDELAQINIPVVLRRVGAATNPMIRYIGVPTLDNYGITAEYRKTDMRRWMVTCGSCGEWQPITWENIDWTELGPEEYDAKRVCIACRKELRVEKGEWVAEHPDRPRVGFHVPRLIVPNANLGEVVKGRMSEKEEEKRAHYNRDLAEPFETAESRLSGAAIESCRRPGVQLVESYVGPNQVTMGIDVSTTRGLHVRISEYLPSERVKRVLWVGVVDALMSANPDEPDRSALHTLATLMAAYRVHMAAIDHLPDGLFSRAFCAAHPGRAYMVAYNGDYRAKHNLVLPKPGGSDVLVVAKRTEWITTTLNMFRHQQNWLPLHDPLPKGQEGRTYEEHLRNVVQQQKTDTLGRDYYAYTQTGPDDFLHAEVYDCVAMQLLRQRLMEGAMRVGMGREEDVVPPNPTPSLSDWDGRPLEEDAARPHAGTYGSEWSDGVEDYRPFGDE